MPREQDEAGSTSNTGGLRALPTLNLLCGVKRPCPDPPFPARAVSPSAFDKDEKGELGGILGSFMAVPLSNSFSSV